MQEARLQIQLKQIVDVRHGSAKFENGLQLVKISQTIDLLANLRTGGRKWGSATITAKKTWSTASFHEGSIYPRYIVDMHKSLDSFCHLPKHSYICSSKSLGALIVDEKPHVKSWDEPQYSIHNLGIEESYGFGVLNEGQAIAVAKNVKVRQNKMSTPGALIISIDPTTRSSSLSSGLLGAAPFDVNNDAYDLETVSFVS
jgi:hypothetical protein